MRIDLSLGRMIADHRSPPSKMNAGKPWSKTDLFFLKVSVESGMPIAKVAGFLGRYEDEVQEKASELKVRRAAR
jgi:hypothetical protein